MANSIFLKIKNNLKKLKLFRLIFYKFRKGYQKYKIFDFLNKDSIFIDLGANIGDISSYINDKFACEIHCYEPHPGAYKYLVNRLKKYKNISFFNYAVSNQNSEGYIYFHKESPNENDLMYSQAASLEEKKENISLEKKFKIKIIHINDILSKFKKIDCIKIDIEGHEYKILPFLINNKHLIKKVVCELHGNSLNAQGQVKNAYLQNEYKNLVKDLKDKKLYNDWFIEWE